MTGGVPVTRSAHWVAKGKLNSMRDRLFLFWHLVLFALLMMISSSVLGQGSSGLEAAPTAVDGGAASTAEGDQPVDPPRPRERKRRSYMGRVLAQPMSHFGADWLVRPERQQEERPDDALRRLKLRPGMTACDLGCGNGFWTLMMAQAVGPQGRVLAVDIQPEMLKKLEFRALEAGVENVEPILGRVNDPRLPAGEVDLLVMVDVYHEFSHPESMLWGIRRSLKPDGVVALLEYREEDPRVPIKPLHKMSKAQIMKEYEANGFKLVDEYNELPWQHLMFFARDDSQLPAIDPKPFAPPH